MSFGNSFVSSRALVIQIVERSGGKDVCVRSGSNEVIGEVLVGRE